MDVPASTSSASSSPRAAAGNPAGSLMSTAANPRSQKHESEAARARAAEAATRRPIEFVCEQDVQEAIKQGRKIYISAKTIITPSARDLGDPREVFVMVKS